MKKSALLIVIIMLFFNMPGLCAMGEALEDENSPLDLGKTYFADQDLIRALEKKDYHGAENLLIEGANPNTGHGGLLVDVVRQEDENAVDLLLRYGADAQCMDDLALTMARHKGNDSLAKKLLCAIALEEAKIVNLLKSPKGDRKKNDLLAAYCDHSCTPCSINMLGMAVQKGHEHITRYLLERNKELVNSTQFETNCASNRTLLHWAVSAGQYATAKQLLEHDACINAQDEIGITPLHCATQTGTINLIKLLLNYNADINAHDKTGTAPLHIAVSEEHEDAVRLFLENKADVTTTSISSCLDETGTPLHIAASKGNTNIAQLLLEHKADVHARNILKKTPLHYAAEQKNSAMLQLLLAHGAQDDINARNSDGQTPLHRAMYQTNVAIVRTLLEHGAHANSTDPCGRTPLDFLKTSSVACRPDKEFRELLLEYSGKCNAFPRIPWNRRHNTFPGQMQTPWIEEKVLSLLQQHPRVQQEQTESNENSPEKDAEGMEEVD